MAIYRNVSMSFWTDSKVAEDFSADDKYFYLYLFTNPHTNLCGCYEISTKQMAYETGLTEKKINELINRLASVHDVIRYCKGTREILLLNWYRYNWTESEKFRKPLSKEITFIKCEPFRQYLTDMFNGVEKYPIDTLSVGVKYPTDTTVLYCSVSDTVSDTDTVPEKTKQKDIFSEVPDEIKDSFMDWVQMRKDKKKPIKTKRAVTMALNKLNALSKNLERQKELIDYAVFRNWDSFYPIPQGDEIPKPKKVEKEKPINAVPMPEETRDRLSALGYGNIIGERKENVE